MFSISQWVKQVLVCAIPAVLLTACAGFGGAVIGGTVSGLASGTTLVVQNNGSESLTISADGSFAFVNGLDSGDTYSVAVTTQPTGQTCTIASGTATGTVDTDSDDVTSIAITCTTTASLGGTITGLFSGTSMTLLNNGATPLIVAANGTFAFPGVITAGTAYNVTISVQPAGQTCTLSNPTGNIVANVMSMVTVSCN
jgi:hypothetical protein